MPVEDFLESHKCAICYEALFRPVQTNCGHLFCHKCIMEALLVSDKCPLCRAKVTRKTENRELQERLAAELTESEAVRR